MKKLLFTFIAVGTMVVSSFAQNEFAVNFKELPKDVQKYIGKNFEGYNVDKAMQGQDNKGNVSFSDVYISKGTEKLKLVFDKDDKFVKKEIITASVAPAPAPPPSPAKPDSTIVAPADSTKK